MTLLPTLPRIRGTYTENAPLGAVGWFRCGGVAEVLFKPVDVDDLSDFLAHCPANITITTLGALSNTIVRDGGVRGVTIRLPGEFSKITPWDDGRIEAGAMAFDVKVASAAAEAGIAGLEFFSGIPGTIGGALRMNAGAYGAETKDVLIEATALDRQGLIRHLTPADMNMRYRHTDTDDLIFTHALFQGRAGDKDAIRARIAEIKSARESTQPIREKTGGSTFANPSVEEVERAGLPDGTKVWQLIDRAGGRGLRVGGAMMSDKHCNFMINTGTATAADLENLGEEIRRRVKEDCGIELRWEVKRIGEPEKF